MEREIAIPAENVYHFLNIYHYEKGDAMKELLAIVGVVAVWYVLNRFVLPKMGIQT